MVDCIHLNPVRAGIVAPEHVVQIRWSSLHRLIKHEGFPGLAPEETRALRTAVWESALQGALRRARWTEGELKVSGKTAARKHDLAIAIRGRIGASVAWLAQRLHLGSPATARCQLSLARKRMGNSPIPVYI